MGSNPGAGSPRAISSRSLTSLATGVRKRKPRIVGLTSLVLLVAVACAPASQSSLPVTADGNRIAANLEMDFPVEFYQGEDALGQPGQDLERFSDLFDGAKPVVLNFWAGDCPPCEAEMPDLDEFNAEYSDRVALFGLDVGPFVFLGTRAQGRALVQKLGVTYPVGTTTDAEVIRSYEVFGMPTTVFLTPDGEVQRKWSGLLTASKLGELTDELIRESA